MKCERFFVVFLVISASMLTGAFILLLAAGCSGTNC